MNLINKITHKYSYNYFDAYNQLQTKQLNIFQYFFRRIFGCYAETHLSNVVKKAYTVTLNDQFQATPKKKQELLKLIAKAENVFGFSQTYMELPDYNLPNGTKVNISLRYQVEKPKNANNNFKISYIDFKLIFNRNSHIQKTYGVSIFKNKSQKLVTHLPSPLFRGSNNDTVDSLKSRLDDERVKTINNLLAKTLNDTCTPEMAEIQYYATDYRWIPGLSRTSKSSPDSLNNTQGKVMNQLGWEYLAQFSESGKLIVTDVKSIYLFKKEVAKKNQALATSGFNQTLSMNFAMSFLEPQTRDY